MLQGEVIAGLIVQVGGRLFGAASALALPAPIRPAKATAGGGCGGDSVIRPAIVAPAIAH